MPSPRKSPPSPEADTSRKKEVAEPKKTADKAQSHKGTQVAKRAKSKAKS
jgi:hypothetical protein